MFTLILFSALLSVEAALGQTSGPTVLFDETHALVATNPKPKKIEMTFDRSLRLAANSGDYFVAVQQTGIREVNFELTINGKRVSDSDDCKRNGEALIPIELALQNTLKIEMRGRSGEGIRLRILNIGASYEALSPETLTSDSDPATVRSFFAPAPGEYLLVAEWSENKKFNSFPSLMLNGQTAIKSNEFERTKGLRIIKLVDLVGENTIDARSKAKHSIALTVSILGFKSPDERRSESIGKLSVTNLIPSQLYPTNQIAQFHLAGIQLPAEFGRIVFRRNGQNVNPSILSWTANHFDVNGLFQDGVNEIEVVGEDAAGDLFFFSEVFWTGSKNVQLRMVDHNQIPILEPTQVVYSFVQNGRKFNGRVSAPSGSAAITNFPKIGAVFDASSANRFGLLSSAINTDVSRDVVMRSNLPATPPTNLDFSNGLEGWTALFGEIELAPRLDGSSPAATFTISPLAVLSNFFAAADTSQPLSLVVRPTTREVCYMPFDDRASFCAVGYAVSNITIPAGSRAVSIYYRFNSPASLGARTTLGFVGAHDGVASFTTQESIPTVGGSLVSTVRLSGLSTQLQVGAYTSVGPVNFQGPLPIELPSVTIDRVVFHSFSVDNVEILDIGQHSSETIRYLSGGDLPLEGSICGNNVPFNFRLRANGGTLDSISDISLKIRQGPNLAIARVNPIFFSNDLFKPFGILGERSFQPNGTIPICYSGLFLPASESSRLSNNDSSPIRVSLVVNSSSGQEIEVPLNRTLSLLLRNPHTLPQFGGRDVNVGGDNWALPHVIDEIGRYKQLARLHNFSIGINDLSNLHGGKFLPHLEHQNGLDVDMRVPAFPFRAVVNGQPVPGPLPLPGQEAAEQLVRALEIVGLGKIERILVTYRRGVDGDPFWDVIKNKSVEGIPLRSIIRSDIDRGSNHINHFHVDFKKKD